MPAATPSKKKPGLKSQSAQPPPKKHSAFDAIEAELSQIKQELRMAESQGDKDAIIRLNLQLQSVRDALDISLGSAFTPTLPAIGDKQVLLDAKPIVDLDRNALLQEQLLWIRSSGPTPVEFLARTYRNPFMDAKDRVAAAKALLEYTHTKLASLEYETTRDSHSNTYQQTLREKLLARLRSEPTAKE